jgi:hypothetical protein
MLPRFSLRAIFALIAAVAVACAVLFAVPEYVRLAILFLGVVAMPGPLAVLARYGSPRLRAFGLGGLVSYAAWLVLVGIPVAFLGMDSIYQYVATPLSAFGYTPGPFGVGPAIVVPSYLVYARLYAPWISVPAAGLASLVIHALCGEKQVEQRPV